MTKMRQSFIDSDLLYRGYIEGLAVITYEHMYHIESILYTCIHFKQMLYKYWTMYE